MTTYLLSNSSAVHCIIKSTESHGLSHGKIHRNLCGGERTDELCSPTSIKYALTLLFSRLGTKRMEEQHIYIASPVAARPRFQRHFYYLLLES